MSRRTLTTLKRIIHWVSPFMGLALFGLSIWALTQELDKYSLNELIASLTAIPKRRVVSSLCFTALNFVMMTGYDVLAVHYIGRPLAYWKVALTASTSFAISNCVGFTLLSGSAIRFRLYSTWGLSGLEVAQIIAFSNLSFVLGLFAVGGTVFAWKAIAVPDMILPFDTLRPLGGIFLSIFFAYLFWNVLSRKPLRVGNLVFPRLPLSLSIAQVGLTLVDWALAAIVLYVLFPEPPLPYPSFLGTYLVAQIAGFISNVPGGLGVFESLMLFFLSPTIASDTLFGILLAFRGIYYFLPLIIAMVSLGLYELSLRLRRDSD
jgi:hypothetical protein